MSNKEQARGFEGTNAQAVLREIIDLERAHKGGAGSWSASNPSELVGVRVPIVVAEALAQGVCVPKHLWERIVKYLRKEKHEWGDSDPAGPLLADIDAQVRP